MDFESVLRTLFSRPVYQRLFMAFTVGLFLSCAARVSEAQPRGESGQGGEIHAAQSPATVTSGR